MNCPVGIRFDAEKDDDATLTSALLEQGFTRVDLLDEVDSTNLVALEHRTPGHFVSARRQTAGRGRLSRSWESPKDVSVMMSVTLAMPANPAHWGWVPLYVGHAAWRAVHSLAPDLAVGVKWPNDLIVRRRGGEFSAYKLAGILCQAVTPQAGSRQLPTMVVAGIGLNVRQSSDELPVASATSLALEGVDVTPGDVLLALGRELAQLATDLGDPSALAARQHVVRDVCFTIGQPVEVHTPRGSIERTAAIGIGDDGQLLTRVADGSDVVSYSVADIVHAKVN